MTGYYNNDSWSNYTFISDPADMQKEISLDDIGKELFFLTKHAFCETCDKTLKAFGSEAKAQALVDKHLGYKKYAGHNAIVKTVDFSQFNKCTTADIVGTKANTERNERLRDSFYGVAKGRIQRLIEEHADTFERIQKAFDLPKREDKVPPCPKDLSDGKVILSNPETRIFATITLDDIENCKQLLDDTWRKDQEEPDDKNTYERASMLGYYINLGRSRYDDLFVLWNYPINFDVFVGGDAEVGDCGFCGKTISNYNDVFESKDDGYYLVHRGCYKHANEAHRLKWYVEVTLPREKEQAERKQREEERDAQYEVERLERQKAREAEQEVTTS